MHTRSFVVLALLMGCGHRRVTPVVTIPPPYDGPTNTFQAVLVGNTIGLAPGCIALDLPPEGRWTVFVDVTDPGHGGQALGGAPGHAATGGGGAPGNVG